MLNLYRAIVNSLHKDYICIVPLTKQIYKETMLKEKKNKIPTNDELRMRVIKLKGGFPSGFDYTPIYVYEFGKQSKEQLNKIRAVWNLREVDKNITENLEKIASNIQD